MSDLQTYIDAISEPRRERFIHMVSVIRQANPAYEPKLWDSGIVGFGSYSYLCGKREERFLRIGFSPRAKELVLYLLPGYEGKEAQLAKLGKHRTGKSCLYIKKLADVDQAVLEDLTAEALAWMDAKYPKEA